MPIEITDAVSNHTLASILFFLTVISLCIKKSTHHLIILSCLGTSITQLLISFIHRGLVTIPLQFIELVEQGIWFFCFFQLLRQGTFKKSNPVIKLTMAIVFATTFLFSLGVSLYLSIENAAHSSALTNNLLLPNKLVSFGQLITALFSLLLIEQVYRNSSNSFKQAQRYIFISVFFLIGYSIYIHTSNTLFESQYNAIAKSNGLAYSIIAFFILISALWQKKQISFSISREMVFYTTSLTISGFFLIIISASAYLVTEHLGQWGAPSQIISILIALMAIAVFISSPKVQSNISVFINKHFFSYKYDYRSIWLDLIKKLSQPFDQADIYQHSIKVVCDVFNCHGGALWLINNDKEYALAAKRNIDMPNSISEPANSNFCKTMEHQEWVFSLDETPHSMHVTKDLPSWANNIDSLWVLTPMVVDEKLLGFFALSKLDQNKTITKNTLSWEDLDLLKTVGRQIGSYIKRQKYAEQLAESKQFDTYNRLTAFIMHDLKNLIAQQALVVENASKHKENPAFVEDAINTIENSVVRMNHLLNKLQSTNTPTPQRRLSLESILLETIRKSTSQQPIPILRKKDSDIFIVADKEQLIMILLHIIKNAQDATKNDGFIDINLSKKENFAIIEVEDNGMGMDEEFIQTRLFKPFESTKTSTGMGIGAYQVREYIQSLGGTLKVTSEIDVGTNVSITLPLKK